MDAATSFWLRFLAAVVFLVSALRPASPNPMPGFGGRGGVYIPGYDNETMTMDFYPVSSGKLVVDDMRNGPGRTSFTVTINSFSDFFSYPFFKGGAHFIGIDDTGSGMTIRGRNASDINAEIDRIMTELPDSARNVTFYHRKDENQFPERNLFTGPFSRTHPQPHQNFYRAF